MKVLMNDSCVTMTHIHVTASTTPLCPPTKELVSVAHRPMAQSILEES